MSFNFDQQKEDFEVDDAELAQYGLSLGKDEDFLVHP